MSAQKNRESVKSGDEVFVISRPTKDIVKRRRAKVLSVHRRSVRVLLEKGREYMVTFDDIEFADGTKLGEETKPEPVVEPTLRPAPLALVPAPAVVQPPPPPVPAAIATEPSDDPRRSLEAWLDMGNEIDRELAVLETELRREKKLIAEEIDALRTRGEDAEKELNDVLRRRHVIRSLRGGTDG